MPRRVSRSSGAIRGTILGLAATLTVAAAHYAGFDDRAESWALDLRFRLLPTVRLSDDIVHVDLDDKALEQIGRWPWPRRRLAQLVDVLDDCGARAVALDIILPHPQDPRYVKEGSTDLYAADASAVLNAQAPPVLVLDDAELARTFARSRNLLVAMHVDLAAPGRRGGEQDRVLQRLKDLVRSRPSLTRHQAARELHLPLPDVQQAMPVAKRRAFETRVEALLRDRPDRSLREVAENVLGTYASRAEDFDILRRAYLRQRALGVMRRFALPPQDISSADLERASLIPPLVTLAEQITRTGFVTVKPDPDGIVRRIPLLVKTPWGVFPHWALRLAADTLASAHSSHSRISYRPGRVAIACADGFVREIPVGPKAYMIINWARPESRRRRVRHVSAVAAADVWTARDRLRRNEALVRLACIEIARSLNETSVLEPVVEADRLWERLNALRLARQADLLYAPARARPIPPALLAREAELDEKIERACRELIEYVDSLLPASAPAGTDAPDAGDEEQVRQIRRWRRLIARARREQARIRRGLEEARTRLRKLVAGKICLVGSVSTGAADFVPTPVHERTPGVVVHANILNTILSGKFVRRPGPWLCMLLILGTGALTALITASRGPIESSILLLVELITYAAIVGTAWRSGTYWVAAVGPVGAMLLTFAVVTVYRQLTEQRQTRRITNTFKQYLSPAMVDRLVSDPSQASLGGQRRELSCLFSDLAGFTGISERLGPEKTVTLLNRYLDQVGEVLQVRHAGTLSKYEGDGVFAFFGAPIPQDDHARRAVRAALEMQELLPEFNRALRAEGLLPEGADLSVRIGITTGEVFVGNMGSTQRVAYTAIGDAVNLASRLETANKFFGTRILVNEDAHRAGCEDVLARPLGRVLVVGKTEPVEVWEPLVRDDRSDEALAEFVRRFAEGVDLYARGEFRAARECFLALLRERDDGPARLYADLCEEAVANPPAEGFDGVIRLTEK